MYGPCIPPDKWTLINYVLSLARHFKQSPPSHLLVAWNKDEAPRSVNHTADPSSTCLYLKQQNTCVKIFISLRYQLSKFLLQRPQALPERLLPTTCPTQSALHRPASSSSHKFPLTELLSFHLTLSFYLDKWFRLRLWAEARLTSSTARSTTSPATRLQERCPP